MTRNLRGIVVSPILAIILLLGVVGYFVYINIQPDNQTDEDDQDGRWVTFVSERASFSFEHPHSWPVIPASDEQLDNVNITAEAEFRRIESINFHEEWYRNAGGSRLGFIVVKRVESVNTLEDYVKTIDKETSIFAKGREVIMPPPNIDYLTIGGKKAILVSDKSGLANLSPTGNDYRLVRNGLLYRFSASLSSRYLENKEVNDEIFQKIISSVKFLD